MSEVDGSYSEGTSTFGDSAALGLSKNMTGQLNYLMPSYGFFWDAIDIHVDANNKYDADDKSALKNIRILIKMDSGELP